MPLKDSTETKMGCQERRGGKMGSWSDLVWIVHGRQLESAALLGFPHLGSLGKRIKLALANSLMHYLPSTLQRNAAKGRKIHGPTPSSPPRRNYEITPRTPLASRGCGPTIEPCSISSTSSMPNTSIQIKDITDTKVEVKDDCQESSTSI